MLVVGIILAVMSVPSVVGALSDGEAPRAGAIVAMIATGLITFAIMSRPSGYAISEIPEVFMRVVGRLIN